MDQSGLRNYATVLKPYLSTKNIEARKEWVRTHKHYDAKQWHYVIFSDESSFTVRPLKQCARVWRNASICYETANMVPTFKSGYVCISLWGAFSAFGRAPLVRIDGTLNKDKYMHILRQYIEPFAIEKHGGLKQIVFQQDNCGPHRAKSVSDYLSARCITTMKWPAQSPDLNPIENVWGVLKHKVLRRSTHPSNADALFQVLCTMWDEISNNYFLKLVHSMPARVKAVIDNRSPSTKY